MGIIFAIFSLSGKIPVLSIWLIIKVIGLTNITFIVFNSLVEISSTP